MKEKNKPRNLKNEAVKTVKLDSNHPIIKMIMHSRSGPAGLVAEHLLS